MKKTPKDEQKKNTKTILSSPFFFVFFFIQVHWSDFFSKSIGILNVCSIISSVSTFVPVESRIHWKSRGRYKRKPSYFSFLVKEKTVLVKSGLLVGDTFFFEISNALKCIT